MSYGCARVNLDGELLQAVKSGALPVKDPLTLGPHTFPFGNALQRAKVAVDDLRAFIEGRGLDLQFVEPHTQGIDYRADYEKQSPEYQAKYLRARRQFNLEELARLKDALMEIRGESTATRREGDAKRREVSRLQASIAELEADEFTKLEGHAVLPPFVDGRGYSNLEQPAQMVAVADNEQSAIDFALLARRDELIAAFGTFTGMNASWFDNLRDRPGLQAACRVKGAGGKNYIEPLFCPYQVMQWLTTKPRKGSRRRAMSQETGWRMLKVNFPKVHGTYSIGDPNTD